jgi:SAM-dependent methyltransferase
MYAVEPSPAPLGSARVAYDAFADVYDAFTWDHDYEDWVTSLEGVAKAHGLSGDRLLDVACGTGKSVVPWLARGYRVVGCDISSRMLSRAARKTGGRARLVAADMRHLPPGEPNDLVTCLGDSVNYLLEPDDLPAAFGSAAGQLRPGGLYLFDLNSLRTYREDFSVTRSFHREGWEFRWNGHGDGATARGATASATVTARPAGSAGPPAMTSVHRQRHYPVPVVRAALWAAGLECLQAYGLHRDGTFDLRFDELAHSKVVVVARKPHSR